MSLIIGLVIGGFAGIVMMCLVQINRINPPPRKEDDNEKEKHSKDTSV
ncbi:MAG: DUF3789 domain-containing protein [Clostridiales bacterium]|nr:DUF3789 domain-containing protein [Clostridiales bacterium]